LLVSVPVAFLCVRLKLPVLVGFMLTGILIGPYGLGLINDLHAIEILAEIGVMLLLFTIGIEFSLKRLSEMKRLVLIGGGLQVGLTIAATAIVAVLFGREINQAIFFGFLVALSSTAIVLKSFVDRNEVDSPHGRAGVGILLFQDISIVLMMLAVPVLGGQEALTPGGIALKLGGSLLALIVIVLAAALFIPQILKQVGRLRSPEIFLLTVVFLFLGVSWVTSQFGLSLALGAFIAGMVLSESDYSHQVSAISRRLQQLVFRFHRLIAFRRRADRKFFDRAAMGGLSGHRQSFDRLVGRSAFGFSPESRGDNGAKPGTDRRIFLRAGKSRARRKFAARC
jgi:monovalent cation:H+ antiporter-2, CPA2 family